MSGFADVGPRLVAWYPDGTPPVVSALCPGCGARVAREASQSHYDVDLGTVSATIYCGHRHCPRENAPLRVEVRLHPPTTFPEPPDEGMADALREIARELRTANLLTAAGVPGPAHSGAGRLLDEAFARLGLEDG